MKLSKKMRNKIDASLRQSAEEHCLFDMTKKSMESIFDKEYELCKTHTDDITKTVPAMTKGYEETMAENSVYRRTYRNEPEKKTDARNALIFGKGMAQIKELLGQKTAQYATVSMGRMEVEKKRKKLTDEAFEKKKNSIAVASNKLGKLKLFLLLPIALAIVFFFVPLWLRPVVSPAVDDYFYSGAHGTPNIVWICFVIGFGGLIVTLTALGLYSNVRGKAIFTYLTESPALKEAEEKDAALTKLYNEKAETAKKNSDAYFKMMEMTIAHINQHYLSVFPAEFANAADLAEGEQLLDSGRAESLKEVYDILERRHNDKSRAQAEAQHRARLENISMEQLRSQKQAEEYARKQAEYAREQAAAAREQAAAAKEQADRLKQIAAESEKQTEYARSQADNANRIQADIDYMKRN